MPRASTRSSHIAGPPLPRWAVTEFTVNVIAPGPIQTGYITPKFAAEISRGTPLGRVGQPDDIADAILLLASAQAHWITGQLLYVGGGWRMPQ